MIENFLEHIDACPTAHHVVNRASALLSANGFAQAPLDAPFAINLLERGFVSHGGTIIAWKNAQSISAQGIRIVGAHTDSPGLHIKPNPDSQSLNWQQLQVEVYGGPLLNSWLDRDLGIAGCLLDRSGADFLVDLREPIARVPQLAIHLDREVNERGLVLDKQQHLSPVWGTGAPRPGEFVEFLAQQTGVLAAGDIAAWDLCLYDLTPAAVLGGDASLLASGRLDNLGSCWAATASRKAPGLSMQMSL